ncbi:MAG: hypothetical protein M0P20_07595, partial [Methanocorpusculum sp.]|nr:hypothetical protein [Methanocorpusculum sp.]
MSDNNGSKQVIDAPIDPIIAKDWQEFSTKKKEKRLETIEKIEKLLEDPKTKLFLSRNKSKADCNLGICKNENGNLTTTSFVGAQWLKKEGENKEP